MTILDDNNIKFVDSFASLADLLDLKSYSKVGILTDTNIEDLWLDEIEDVLGFDIVDFVIEAGEESKDLENLQFIWSQMLEEKFDRKSLLINLGGGMVSDIGGFAASTYMRGIDFINIPTSLLSQVDASVGGKNGINFSGVKNILGTFDQPKLVVINTSVLETLPKRDIASGFAEVIKYGLIYDKELFKFLSERTIENFTTNDYEYVVERSCEIKAEIVGTDEREQGLRKILNFGHTIGHAIEALSHKAESVDKVLVHGEAIAIGMVGEFYLSQKIYPDLANSISLDEVKKIFSQYNLPISHSNIHIEEMMILMLTDKKNVSGEINFVLLEELGKAVFDKQVDADMIREALHSIQKYVVSLK